MSKISMVENVKATACKPVGASNFVEDVISGRWRDNIESIRRTYQMTTEQTGGGSKQAGVAIRELKSKLPGVLWAGVFCKRCAEGIEAHSGLLVIDLDHLGTRLTKAKEKLSSDPHVFACFVSPSGDGLKAVFSVPPDIERHATAWATAAKRVESLTGIKPDHGDDVARLCFVSYDPEAHHNPQAEVLEIEAEDTVPAKKPRKPTHHPASKHSTDSADDEAKIKDALCYIPADNYDSWIEMGMALHSWNSQRGLNVWTEWSRTSPEKYDQSGLPKRWSGFESERPGGVTLGTLFEYAKQGGWTWQGGCSVTLGGSSAKEPTTSKTQTEDELVLNRLAKLSPLDYDRCREKEAKQLGIRPASLDKEVGRRRKSQTDPAQGKKLVYDDPVPCDSPVVGGEVLNQVAGVFRQYVVLPDGAADALALWVAHAHVFEAFELTPRLNFFSPEKGCGKTTLLDVLATVTPRAQRMENISTAATFRLVEKYKPILLLDEVDTYLSNNEELRGLLNAGHRRGAQVLRCEGDNHDLATYGVFAPAVLAGIGSLPGTLEDRSVVVRLARAKQGEVEKQFDSRRLNDERIIHAKLARWCQDQAEALAVSDPKMPASAFNRVADNWRPLFAVAEEAGGDWPARATKAYEALTAENGEQGINELLLSDIKKVLESDSELGRITSATLVAALAQIEERPWAEYGRSQKPITARQVARMLKSFKISSRQIRVGESTCKGYHVADFDDAFARYLPPSPPPKRNSETNTENIDPNEFLNETNSGACFG